MARNEEKQQGKLNRLWLQKEREVSALPRQRCPTPCSLCSDWPQGDEGRLKDVHERRPKLSTLNSAASIKKWIPSIKNEIEYYLQQSQLSHYPERKIAEFQVNIEALEKEYKSHIAKLRVLDPSCKHKPWTPRAYCKRQADAQDSPSTVKMTRSLESLHGSCQRTGGERDLNHSLIGGHKTSEKWEPLSHLETKLQPPVPVHTKPISETSDSVCADQDQPLCFDQTRLQVAAAAFRGPSVQRGSSHAQSLARVLQSGLPNLGNNSLRPILSTHSSDTEKDGRWAMGSVIDSDAITTPGKSCILETTEERTGHVLGLDCYSSSDEETDT